MRLIRGLGGPGIPQHTKKKSTHVGGNQHVLSKAKLKKQRNFFSNTIKACRKSKGITYLLLLLTTSLRCAHKVPVSTPSKWVSTHPKWVSTPKNGSQHSQMGLNTQKMGLNMCKMGLNMCKNGSQHPPKKWRGRDSFWEC